MSKAHTVEQKKSANWQLVYTSNRKHSKLALSLNSPKSSIKKKYEKANIKYPVYTTESCSCKNQGNRVQKVKGRRKSN